MDNQYQVIIVGGGPVGVALAVELGLRGVSCALIERRRKLQNIPKGQNLTQRTLEHFYFWGIVDELRAARVMPAGYPIGGVTAYKSLMGEYWHAPAGREVVRSYYFQENDRMPQYCMEDVLRRKLATLNSVGNYFGWTVESVAQDDVGVEVTITGADGERKVLTGDYAVGCDGGHSLVREQVGIARGGKDFDQVMMLAVFRSRELHEGLKRFPERSTYRVLHPDLKGYWQFFGRIDVGEGFFFHAPVPRDATPDNFDFLGLLHHAAGFEFAAEFDHIGFWDLRVMVASQYRLGRTFIAGDACHQHPPYGGFGLNTGLEDAVNLGWKLAATLHGWGGQQLLDSYGQERRPIFVETGEAMIAGGIERDRQWLEKYNPDKDKAEFERAWAEYGALWGARPQTYEPHYEGSPTVIGPQGGVCSIHGRMSFKAEAGHHLAPRDLSSGRNVFEELGDDFTLLAFGAEEQSVHTLEVAAQTRGVPLKVVRDSFADGREEYGSRLVLVRPDQYVVWSADAAPEDATGLLARVTGRGASR